MKTSMLNWACRLSLTAAALLSMQSHAASPVNEEVATVLEYLVRQHGTGK